jgi:outer membrane protein TolC
MKNSKHDCLFFCQLLAPLLALLLWSQAQAQGPTQTQASGASLRLDAYLQQVQKQNDGVRAGQELNIGAEMQSDEAKLALSPALFANAQRSTDRSPSQFPGLIYDKQVQNIYSLGVSQNTSFGLQGKLYYTLLYNAFVDGPSSLPPGFYESKPTLELTQSLWRNFLGHETNAQIEAGVAQAKATSAQADYQVQSLLLQAEAGYWQLALAREAVKVSSDAADRAKRLYDFYSKRAENGLADRSDFLQASAALESRKLDLKSANDDERTAARAFNSSRGVDSDDVSEILEPLNANLTDHLKIPQSRGNRADVVAAGEQSKATMASAKLAREKDLPTLELFGSVSLNGNSATPYAQQDDALAGTFDRSRPSQAVGIRLQAPLDIALINRSREGWKHEEEAARYTYQRKLFEQERDWNDLIKKFSDAKDRLVLFQSLEETQKTKLTYEKQRQARGRTTTQQVLLFEVDYELAQLGRIRTLAELVQLFAQMKLYGAAHESR